MDLPLNMLAFAGAVAAPLLAAADGSVYAPGQETGFRGFLHDVFLREFGPIQALTVIGWLFAAGLLIYHGVRRKQRVALGFSVLFVALAVRELDLHIHLFDWNITKFSGFFSARIPLGERVAVASAYLLLIAAVVWGLGPMLGRLTFRPRFRDLMAKRWLLFIIAGVISQLFDKAGHWVGKLGIARNQTLYFEVTEELTELVLPIWATAVIAHVYRDRLSRLRRPGEWSTRARMWVVIGLIAVWAAAYLPNLGARPLRYEEGRRVTPAREMIQTGEYFLPRLYGDPYLNKPPVFFWVVGGTGTLTGGVNELAVRLPSAVSVLAGALLMLAFARRQLNFGARALAALMVLACVRMLSKGTVGEIDAFLSLLVWAAFVLFWEGYSRAHPTDTPPDAAPDTAPAVSPPRMFRWWLATGAVLGLAVMTKGPNGLGEFYLPLVAFLIWERRAKLLATPGHIACLVLALAPIAAWVAWLISAGHMTSSDGAARWVNQAGANSFSSNLGALAARYALFPVEVMGMLLPWTPWALAALLPGEARAAGIPRSLARFLAAGIIAMFVGFWLWPSSQSRYIMAVVFPACALVGTYLEGGLRRPAPAGLMGALRTVGLVAAAALVGAAAWAIVQVRHEFGLLPHAIAGGLLCVAAGVVLFRFMLRTSPLVAVPVSLAITVSVAVAGMWWAAYALPAPLRAREDVPRLVAAQVRQVLAATSPDRIYTLRRHALDDGRERGADLYNIQFYFAPTVIGVDGVSDLPAGRPVILVAGPDDAAALAAPGVGIETLARIPVRRGVEDIVLLRITRP